MVVSRLMVLVVLVFGTVAVEDEGCINSFDMCTVAAEGEEECIDSYTELERRFIARESNIVNLQNTFYPVNQATPSYILVSYYYDTNDTQICPNTDSLKVNLRFKDLSANKGLSTDAQQLCNWVWTDSAVYIVYSPWMLNTYSLLIETFFTSLGYDSKTSLQIDHFCHYQHIQKLTSRLKVISSGRTGAISKSSFHGFAFQLKNIRNVWMVHEETNDALRLFAHVTKYTMKTGIGLVTIIFAALLFKLAKRYKTTVKLRAQNSDIFYAVIWSVVIVSLLVICVSITITITLILVPLHGVKELGLNIAYLVGVILVEFVLAVLIKKDDDFRIPKLLTCCYRMKRNTIVQTLALWIVFVSMQLLLFHGIFIFIVFINHPLGSLCMTMVYALALYCLVTIFATAMLGGMVSERAARCERIGSAVRNAMKMLAAFMFGVVLLCLFVLAAGFTFVDGTINPFRVTAIANPLIASTTLATMGWIARKMVIRYWLESESDETFVIL